VKYAMEIIILSEKIFSIKVKDPERRIRMSKTNVRTFFRLCKVKVVGQAVDTTKKLLKPLSSSHQWVRGN